MRPSEMDPTAPIYDTDRVWTLPNVLSLLRLAGVPVLLWLILGPRADLLAVAVLMVAGFTDWLDGHLARTWNQRTRFGEMLDPIADRFYILAILIGLAVRGIVPWWLMAALVLRDVLIALLVPLLRTRGFSSLPVHFLGKAATFNLLYAFPLVLLGASDPTSGLVAEGGLRLVARAVGWANVWWGTALYWWAGALYLLQTVRLLRSTPRLDRHRQVPA